MDKVSITVMPKEEFDPCFSGSALVDANRISYELYLSILARYGLYSIIKSYQLIFLIPIIYGGSYRALHEVQREAGDERYTGSDYEEWPQGDERNLYSLRD